MLLSNVLPSINKSKMPFKYENSLQNTLQILFKMPLERFLGIYGPENQSERCWRLAGYCNYE